MEIQNGNFSSTASGLGKRYPDPIQPVKVHSWLFHQGLDQMTTLAGVGLNELEGSWGESRVAMFECAK